jgi:4-hydroxybenzoate polyprenyltransferase
MLGAVGVLSVACWTLGFYPLTGVYQIAADSQRGMRTLAVALGVNGCFLFAAIIAPLGGLGVWAVLYSRGAYSAMGLSAIYMLGAGYYTWQWYRQFTRLTTRENQRKLMRLSYANGLAFTVLFLALVLFAS